MTLPLVVLGDTLLDVDLIGAVTRQCPDAPDVPVLDVTQERRRPGGAGLAALLAAAGPVPVRLVTALAADADGAVLRALLEPQVEVVAGRVRGMTARKCRLRAGGRSLSRVDRGDGTAEPATAALADALEGAGAVLVSDYGRGLTGDPLLRGRLRRLAADVPVVWDPHPQGTEPVTGCALASPNLAEALRGADRPGSSGEPAAGAAKVLAAGWAAARLRARWRARGVVVTLGADGALLHWDNDNKDSSCRGVRDSQDVGSGTRTQLVPAGRVSATDPCGAGDRFAASAALALLTGRTTLAAVHLAVQEATRFVATGGAAAVGRSVPDGAVPEGAVPEDSERKQA